MAIEWDETVETTRRVRLFVDLNPSDPFDAPDEVRDATVDDLRRACEAAGLELFTAQHKADCEDARGRLDHACQQHAEDLEKLGREMNEVVAQRDEAREERDQYLQACENWRKLDAPLSEFRRVLRVGDYESTLDAARRMSREVEVCVGQLDHVMARAESARLEAYTLGRKSAEEQEAAWESERAELVAARDETDGNVRALKLRHVDVLGALGATIGETIEVAARRVVAERDAARERADKAEARSDALAAELSAIRAATGKAPSDEVLHGVWRSNVNEVDARRELYNLGRDAARGEVARMREEVATLRARVAELEAIAREAESQANDMVAQKIAALGMAVNGAEDEEMVSPDVQVVRGDFVMTKFRERLARIDAASPPAPQGQPVATDEELSDLYVHERSLFLEDPDRTGTEARRLAIRAVARHVRAERPACLVARAVALGCDVWVTDAATNGVTSWSVEVLDNNTEASRRRSRFVRKVPAADVPATLARLLDEVEAARKAVQR